MRTYAHARTYSACGLHTEESRRIHINKNGYSQRLELWVTWILHFSFYWFSTVLQGTCIIWITHTKALIVIYIYIKKRFWVLEKTSGRTLRPGIFEDTLSTALEEAPGPRTPPRRGPYLRSLRPLFAISAQAALLCLLIRWGLSQRERELASGVCVEKEITWIQPGPVICFTLDSIHILMLFSWNIPPSPSPTESKRLFYKSVSLFLFCI